MRTRMGGGPGRNIGQSKKRRPEASPSPEESIRAGFLSEIVVCRRWCLFALTSFVLGVLGR